MNPASPTLLTARHARSAAALLAVFTNLASGLLAQDPTGQNPTAAGNTQQTPVPTGRLVSGPFRYLDMSLMIMGAAGSSTARNDVLQQLQAGQHDPNRRGFTLQEAEFAISGAVDENFSGHAYLTTLFDPEGETIVELEEAFLLTESLPHGFQLKAGTYFTEFGMTNSRHPHLWRWIDQPVINSRILGADGMRGQGARVSWDGGDDLPLYAIFGVQNAIGETMPSFLANDEIYDGGNGIGGRQFGGRDVRSGNDLVYTGRLVATLSLGDETDLEIGGSVAFGPNATGNDGETILYGADFALLWAPEDQGHASESMPADGHEGHEGHDHPHTFFALEGEFIGRVFDAAAQVDSSDPMNPVAIPGTTLDDYGGFLQAVYGFGHGWGAGLRAEFAGGSGASYRADTMTFSRAADPFRTDRMRISPLLVWRPSHDARFRLQYNYEDSDHLSGEEHTVWIGFDVLIGNHHHRR